MDGVVLEAVFLRTFVKLENGSVVAQEHIPEARASAKCGSVGGTAFLGG